MGWETVSLKYKIRYLKELMKNTKKGTFSKNEIYSVDALLFGSSKKGFKISDTFMGFLNHTWERAVQNQKDSIILDFIKKEIQKV